MDDVQECTIMCLSLQFVYIPFPLRESYMLDLLPQYFEIILLTWYVWHAEVVILLIWVTPVGWGNAANGFPTRWGGGGCSPCRSGELDTVWLITGGGGGLFLLPDLSPAGGSYTFLFFIKSINPISSGLLYIFFPVHPAGKYYSLALLVNGAHKLVNQGFLLTPRVRTSPVQ